MNKTIIKQQLKKFSDLEDELLIDFDKEFNRPFFSGIGWIFLDVIVGITGSMILLVLFGQISIMLGGALAMYFFFWYSGEKVIPIKAKIFQPNIYTFYNWKTGALDREKKIRQMKSILEGIKR